MNRHRENYIIDENFIYFLKKIIIYFFNFLINNLKFQPKKLFFLNKCIFF